MAVALRITFVGLAVFVQDDSGITTVLLPATQHHDHGGAGPHVPAHEAFLYLGAIKDVTKGGGRVPAAIPLGRMILTIHDSERATGSPPLPEELFSMRSITSTGVLPEALVAIPDPTVLHSRINLDLHGDVEGRGTGEVELREDGQLPERADMATFVVWTEIVDSAKLKISLRSMDVEGLEFTIVPEVPDATQSEQTIDLTVYHVPKVELPPAMPPAPVFGEAVEHFSVYYALFERSARHPMPYPVKPTAGRGGITGSCMILQA